MLPAGVDINTPSETSFLIIFCEPLEISSDAVCLLCLKIETSLIAIDFLVLLNLDSKKLSIRPISAFRPRRWKGRIVSDKSKITIKNLNINKRPISAVADNYEVRNAKKISIKINKKIKFNLLYDLNRSLQKKIKIEQIRKETN